MSVLNFTHEVPLFIASETKMECSAFQVFIACDYADLARGSSLCHVALSTMNSLLFGILAREIMPN